jgi:small-conductance mechanosensitive channel
MNDTVAPIEKETKRPKEAAQLARMEEAAKTSSNPQQIKKGRGGRCEPASSNDKLWLGTFTVLLLIFVGAHFFLNWQQGLVSAQLLPRALNYVHGAALIAAVLLGARLIEVLVIGRVASPVNRFNLKRILRLVVVLSIVFTAISVLFVHWYAAAVSLGLISLILGFALQTPISSFIGWIYLLVRAPYRVGDRIKMGDLRGDVIDVSYLDTTLWEIGGEYLSGDHPSGRVIRIPNAKVLSDPVTNYSWPLFPYIWNEIRFQLAYESDLLFVAETMRRIVGDEVGDAMTEKVKVYREILARTPVDELDVQDKPVVVFRVSDNTWVEAVVRYLVEPREAGRVKARLLQKLLAALNAVPDKVLFPKGNMR